MFDMYKNGEETMNYNYKDAHICNNSNLNSMANTSINSCIHFAESKLNYYNAKNTNTKTCCSFLMFN